MSTQTATKPFVIPIAYLLAFSLPRHTRVYAALLLTSMVFASFFLYNGKARGTSFEYMKSVPVGMAASASLDSAASPVEKNPEVHPSEIHVANNGLVLLRGARVVSNSGGAILVALSWNGAAFTWTIYTKSSTSFVTSNGEKASIQDVHIGDIVTVTGDLRENNEKPTIEARIVREQ